MNMALTRQESTMAIATCNKSELTSTTTKLLAESMSRVQFLLTWNQGPWMPCVLVHMANFSDLITLSFVRELNVCIVEYV